jgi:alanyl-tRNA synthetase
MGQDFPEIRTRAPHVRALIEAEEERFNRTLDQGIGRFEEVVAELKGRGEKTIPGADVFFLYDTCGFPVDLVERMAAEIGFSVDLAGYQAEMERQKERSRGSGKFKAAAGEGRDLKRYPPTRFVGYDLPKAEAELMGAESRGECWELVLSQTPFYAEGGGQVGDTGLIRGEGFSLRVEDTRKEDGRFLHRAVLAEGDPERLRPGGVVTAEIDVQRREAIERSHTATHLLHAALRKVVGTHVHQKGSLVEASRLRFDVSHFKPLSAEELERVEGLVVEALTRDEPVETFETDHAEAVKMGAMALFGEKYGDRVRVVRIGDFSLELCGGTHVGRTGEIGGFLVAAESSVAAGVRRLQALTAEAALRRQQENARILAELSARLKCPQDQLLERVQKLVSAGAAARPARPPAGEAKGKPEWAVVEKLGSKEGEVLVLSGLLEGGSMEDLLALFDRHKSQGPRTAAVLLAREAGKVQVLVALTPALAKGGLDAREIFAGAAEILGARGGGRPEMVRGSGSRPEGAEGALESLLSKLKGLLT